MTDAQRKLAKLQIEQSENRQKINDLLSKEDRSGRRNGRTGHADKTRASHRAGIAGKFGAGIH